MSSDVPVIYMNCGLRLSLCRVFLAVFCFFQSVSILASVVSLFGDARGELQMDDCVLICGNLFVALANPCIFFTLFDICYFFFFT